MLDIAGVSSVGSFVIQSIGLGHLWNNSIKDRSAIVKDARKELSSALAILLAFHNVINDDNITDLVGRYTR
jgi:hypothetical protein